MPWTVDDPPPPARNWTREEREKCVAAANAAPREGSTDEEAIFACIRAAGKSEDDKMAKRESLRDRVQVEHKSFPATSLKILDAEQGIVESVVAVFGNKDEGGDIIHPGAFSKTLVEGGRKIRVLDHHNSWSSRDVVGKPLELREIGREALPPETLARFPDATGGLFAKTQFALATQAGRETFSLLREGYIDEWSIGYDPIVADFDDEGATRNLRELRLWEYSPVIWGMNQGTATVSAKQQEIEPVDGKGALGAGNFPLAARDREWDAAAADARCRRWAGGPDADSMDWTKYRRCFLWYDADNPENFGSYKLGYVDIIDGEAHIIPRAVFAIAGGRGVDRADIPDADKEKIRGTVNRLYARMRREFDDDTLVSPFEKALAVPKEIKNAVGRLIEALQDFQAATVSQSGNEEETDAEPPTVVSDDAHEETNAVSDEGAGPESDGPSDTPPTSEDVDTLLAQVNALLDEVNDELQRGAPGGAQPD